MDRREVGAGDLFSEQPELYACLGDDTPHLERVCGDLEPCPVTNVGPCAGACDGDGCRLNDELFAETVTVYRNAGLGSPLIAQPASQPQG